MKIKNTIEFNGHRYDTASGQQLDSASSPSAVASIDGIITAHASPVTTVATPSANLVSTPVRNGAMQQRDHQPFHAKPHRPQAATTLMRGSVKRPANSLKSQTAVQGTLQHAVPSVIAPKQSAYALNPARLARAKAVERSPLVSRHTSDNHNIPVTFAPLHVQPVPVKPEAQEPRDVPHPAAKPLDMFEHAIANASNYIDVKAHHAKFKKHRRSHALSLATGGLALIVIAGFAAYQNSPSLQFRVASMHAGVSAHMPNVAAAGFTYNGVKGGDGKLAIGLKAKDANYQLVQKTTNLSSDDLIANVGAVDASGNPNYTTVQTGSTTVYRFSNTEATWVANGNWYSVSGNKALTDSQVTALVNNL